MLDIVGNHRRTMSGVVVALVTAAVVAPCAVAWAVNPAAARLLIPAAVLGTSIWAALDSRRLRLEEYPSPASAHPFFLFTALLALWILVFPAYLIVRSRIRAGLLPRVVNPHGRRLFYVCIALWSVPIALKLLAWFASKNLTGLQ